MAAGISGWTDTNRGFRYTDRGQTEMQILRRGIAREQTISLPQGGWTGTLLLIPPVDR